MVRIIRFTDIWKADNIPKYIADVMEHELLTLCKEYLVDSIESFGAFYYMESADDYDCYRETGMTERIEHAEPEFIKMFHGSKEELCFQSCHLINDEFAIYVFCEHKVIMEVTSRHPDSQNSS